MASFRDWLRFTVEKIDLQLILYETVSLCDEPI